MNIGYVHGRGWMLRMMGALLMAAMSVGLAAGCGGGSENGNGGPTRAPTQQAESTPQPSSGSATLFLTANNFDTIKVSLKAGDKLKVKYVAQSVIVGAGDVSNLAQAGAIMAINDPSENSVYRGEQEKTDEIELTADANGEHEIIFQNPFPLQAQSVTVTYSINQ
ncbi:MAG: emp24/gp25L/p24 family protein [SAR202 cluster bacterium]|nr:emp24/gp25L/p24 family protein [SAR202 cluster bacterium]